MAEEKTEEKASGFTAKGFGMVAVVSFVVVYLALGTTFDGLGLGKAKAALFKAGNASPQPANWS